MDTGEHKVELYQKKIEIHLLTDNIKEAKKDLSKMISITE